MKLVVQGIEEIELTDPQGLCRPKPGTAGGVIPQPPQLFPPQLPSPSPHRTFPGGSDWRPKGDPTIRPIPRTPYTKHVDPNDRTKWGIGGPMIQQAGDLKEVNKWEKNWQANMGDKGAEGEKGAEYGDGHAR